MLSASSFPLLPSIREFQRDAQPDIQPGLRKSAEPVNFTLGLSMTTEPVLAILAEAKKLAQRYRVLTGKPLGITGEVAEYEAARILGVELTPLDKPATTPRRFMMVKSSGSKSKAGACLKVPAPASAWAPSTLKTSAETSGTDHDFLVE